MSLIDVLFETNLHSKGVKYMCEERKKKLLEQSTANYEEAKT